MRKTLLAMVLMAFPLTGFARDLKVGDPAPALHLQTDAGTAFSLQERKGKWTVLYFYPKAGTPGCTKEACAYRDNLNKIRALGAEIFGVSADTVQSLKVFKKDNHLNFTLLADPELKAIRAYGTEMPAMKRSKRWTFIIGPELKIRFIEKDVDPVLDARSIADELMGLQAIP